MKENNVNKLSNEELLSAEKEISENISLLKRMSVVSLDMFRKLTGILKELRNEITRRSIDG